jgi:hypothetical protein
MPVSIFGSTSNTGVDRKVPRYNARAEPINMNGRPIKNLPFPDEQTDAANRRYVDEKINNLDDELKQYINSVIEGKVKAALEYRQHNYIRIKSS